MPTKKELLRNLREYSPDQIADAVRSGVVSMYELTTETGGAFTPLLKKQVKAILDAPIAPTNIKSENSVSEEECAPETDATTTTAEPMPEIPVVSLFDATSDSLNPSSVTETTKSSEYEIEPKPRMFSRPFSFKGRIRRLEYGLSVIISFFVSVIMQVMLELGIDSESAGLLLVYFILLIPYCWFTLAQGAKRCHDRGNSGWYQIIPFYYIVLLFGDGEKGTNSYGVSPK